MTELLKRSALPTKGKTPLMLEIPVNPATSPYLVTAAGRSKLIWIPTSANGKVKAGVRTSDRATINRAIAEEVALVGSTNGWGNVHDLTEIGLQKATEHLSFYGIEDFEVLVGSEGLPFVTDLSVVECKWLDGSGFAVVLPKDRDFVGMLFTVGKGYMAVVHNPSRGIAVLRSS